MFEEEDRQEVQNSQGGMATTEIIAIEECMAHGEINAVYNKIK